MAARTRRGAHSCGACGATVIRQLVGRMAALNVTADAEPLPLTEALALTTPNRLAWCLAELHAGGRQLRWLHEEGLPCKRKHVIEHECPAGTPLELQQEGTLW
jgi:hypothetical protein